MALEPLLILRPANGGVTPGALDCALQPALANRHGLIAGASGTGKTLTLKRLWIMCWVSAPTPRRCLTTTAKPWTATPPGPPPPPPVSKERLLPSLAGEAGNLFGGGTGRSIARGLLGGNRGRR
jgi:hypothetical protein